MKMARNITGYRGGRHSQRPPKFVCMNCKKGACEFCIDLARDVYTNSKICDCENNNHQKKADAVITFREPTEFKEPDSIRGRLIPAHKEST